ncbi:YbhB/YbcL family Raf kinase inhibitor-like protein [Nocardia sp. alder85J]|uniref:YbhB/YbcL family Raf kinase inhibitor-like protein n=1 Tax=Nocardia sp. alder85J TaxID=2862949 RepID=UPI001CD4B1C3|nr:YbhB/YbcL family Raf kinase inhibitor-like protein [Nocardia sp. alder85J]MCX4090911.1 YbhB/YbcL family Raf kinase inhibitor-like protein [Nocardia sp. alder85J]
MTSPGNRRPGRPGLAWHAPNLAGAETLTLRSPDFDHEHTIPIPHAATRAGGDNLSPALTWSAPPTGTAQLLLVIEDPDAATPTPFVHCLALLDPAVTTLAHGALHTETRTAGVHLLRSTIGTGYFGMAPPKSHGPHRYVFQLFALATPLAAPSPRTALDAVPPGRVIAAARDVRARGRLDGVHRRT